MFDVSVLVFWDLGLVFRVWVNDMVRVRVRVIDMVRVRVGVLFGF